MYNAIIFTDLTDNEMSTIYLGPYKCAHVIRKAGYSCLVINHVSGYTSDELKQLLNLAVGDKTYLVGFSTTFMTLTKVFNPNAGLSSVFPQGKEFEDDIISFIKQKNSNVKTVAGGANVTAEYYNKNIDYVSIGYSEIAIVNLIDHLIHNDPLNHSYKNIHGRIIIDDRKATDYNFPKGDMVWLDTDVVNHKVLPIEIGRGCIFKCKFCSFPMNGKQQLDFVKNPNILYNELLKNYNDFGITKYIIVDDTFNDHIEKLETIHEQIKRLPFQPTFWAYTRLDLICTRPETLKILYEIGIRTMFFGIETLHSKAGRTVGKGFDGMKQLAMVKHIKETYPDIIMHGSFIFGLPHEPVESMQNTAKLLFEGDMPLDSWVVNTLSIRKKDRMAFSSDFTNNFESYGYIDVGDLPGGNNHNVNWKNPFTTAQEVMQIVDAVQKQSFKYDHFTLGSLAFHIQTLGYSLDETRTMPARKFDWDNFHATKHQFIEDYKAQLLALVKQKLVNTNAYRINRATNP